MTWTSCLWTLRRSMAMEPSPTILRIADESKRALFLINAEVGRFSLWPGRRGGTGGLGLPKSS